MERKQKKLKISSDKEEVKSDKAGDNGMSEAGENSTESPDAAKNGSHSDTNNQSSTERNEKGNVLVVGDWSEVFSKSSKKFYYYNSTTNVSQWDRPKELIERERLQNLNQPTTSKQAHIISCDSESSKLNEKAECLVQAGSSVKDELAEQSQTESARLFQCEEDLRKKDGEIDRLNGCMKKKDEEITRLNGCLTKLKSQTESARLFQCEEDLKKKDEAIAQLNGCVKKKDEEIARLNGCMRKKDEEIAQLNDCLTKLKESDDTEFNINSLPDEVFIKIFGYLSQNELGRIAWVCKQWRELARSPLLWKRVNVKFHWSHESQNKVVTLLCETLPTCMTHIKLDFGGYCKWKESLNFHEFCIKLGTSCPSLKSLRLYGTIFSVDLQSVVDLCIHYLSNLEILLFVNSFFTNYSVQVEYSDHPKIKVLCIIYINSPVVKKLTLPKLSSLRELRLESTEVNDDWFQGDVSFLHHLQVLSLKLSFIGSRTIQTLHAYASKLIELHMCHTYLKDSDFNFRSAVFPQLKTLCLISNHHVTCEGVVSFVRSCPSLQNVYVNRSVAESYAVHPFIAANPCKSQIVKTVFKCVLSEDNLY